MSEGLFAFILRLTLYKHMHDITAQKTSIHRHIESNLVITTYVYMTHRL